VTVGFHSPLPPQRTGVAGYSEALLAAVCRLDTDLSHPIPAIPGYPPAPAELCVCANIDCGGFYCRGGDDATPLHPPTTEGEPK
jgi:hypothetical protein